MNRHSRAITSSFFLVALLPLVARAAGTLSNDAYRVDLADDGSVLVAAKDGASKTFRPEFTVLHRVGDPAMKYQMNGTVNAPIPQWRSAEQATLGKPTWNHFKSGHDVVVKAERAALQENRITWSFAPHAKFRLTAELTVPAGSGEPVVAWTLEPLEAGYYSVGYTGAPEAPPGEVDFVWQPPVWQEKRFPTEAFLSTEMMALTPATLVAQDGVTTGVAIDPGEVPYRMPTAANARFGVIVRNVRGRAQPQAFAPVMGLAESKMEPGKPFRFRVRLVVRKGGWFDAFRHLATGLYRFRDVRENNLCTLNQTIENMIEYAMRSKFSGWEPANKAFDYTTDVRDTVKLVSAVHPLALAALTDDESIMRERVVPMTEFLLSREKFLFAETAGGSQEQQPSRKMSGPGAEPFEWSTLYSYTGGRTSVFRAAAEERQRNPRALNLDTLHKDAAWVDALALYRATGDRAMLDKAIAGADEYVRQRIDTPQTDFRMSNLPGSGQFWTDFAPRWMQLIELYEETKEKRYLDAAVQGARLHAAYCWTSPVIPDGDVTVNPGGKVKGHHEVPAPEETVPAWWVSQVGLTPEASNTYRDNPGVLLAHYAPWMLRLAHYTGDDYFRTLARSAVVGRYANYPGYDINYNFSTVYMKPDYVTKEGDPYHRYNQLYLNHVWPHIALLTDYLFTDALAKSKGQVSFPSRYAQGYVYLQSKVYGDRPGTFYGDANVRPYLPRGLVTTDTVQANYVAGYGNGNLYVALMNQSPREADVALTLDAKRLNLDPSREYAARVWRDNLQAGKVAVKRGKATVPLSGHGITALAIEGITPAPTLQPKLFDAGATKPLTADSHKTVDWPLGKAHGMVLSFGRDLTSGYVWLDADEKQARAAKLTYRVDDGEPREATDDAYPFEFSLPLADDVTSVAWTIEARSLDGQVVRTPEVRLGR